MSAQNEVAGRPASHPLVVELGIGDGRFLKNLAKAGMNQGITFEGFEVDPAKCELAREFLPSNATVINSLCQDALRRYDNCSVDEFISILPDPALIDQSREDDWREFYRVLYLKLRPGGRFHLITELTNDLFEPVPPIEFYRWVDWLVRTFESINFKALSCMPGAPSGYSTGCLDQFAGDPERIRIVTLELIKPLE